MRIRDVVLIILGLVAACVFTGCSTGGVRRSGDADAMAHQTFARYPIGDQQRQTGFLHLMRGRFDCPDRQRRAVWYQFGGYIAVGCWRIQDGKIWAKFDDGDDTEVAPVGDTSFGPEA